MSILKIIIETYIANISYKHWENVVAVAIAITVAISSSSAVVVVPVILIVAVVVKLKTSCYFAKFYLP